MKRFYYRLFIAFLFFLPINLFGQILIGAQLGYSRTTTAKDLGAEPYNGFIGGFTTAYALSDNLSLNSGLLYNERGYTLKESAFDAYSVQTDAHVKFKYIDIPFLVEYKINTFLAIEAGPFISFQVSRKLYYGNEMQSSTLMGQKQLIDLGLEGGLKLHYNNLYLSALYKKGFLPSFKNADAFKCAGFTISMGYQFNIR